MKKLHILLLVLIILLVGIDIYSGEKIITKRLDPNIKFSHIEARGMSYVIAYNEKSGIAVINLTLDSLKARWYRKSIHD